jgi:hypothetical protein
MRSRHSDLARERLIHFGWVWLSRKDKIWYQQVLQFWQWVCEPDQRHVYWHCLAQDHLIALYGACWSLFVSPDVVGSDAVHRLRRTDGALQKRRVRRAEAFRRFFWMLRREENACKDVQTVGNVTSGVSDAHARCRLVLIQDGGLG